MKVKTRFPAFFAALAAALILISLLLPSGNHSKDSESKPGSLIAAALSGAAKQGDDLEMNSLLELSKKSGLISRATLVNPSKRIVADTEAEAIGSFLSEKPGAAVPENYDIPGSRGSKLIIYYLPGSQGQFSVSSLCAIAALAAALLSAALLFFFAGQKNSKIERATGAAEAGWELMGRMLKKGGLSGKYVVLDSSGTIAGSGPSEEQEIHGKKLFDCGLKDRILKSAENPENVFDVAGMKFIFY